ncbi:urotensin 1 [Phyllopteryx taeniolatus]|uniref:urotensin 1 n=1 Tax=Phyllopteryx taeniolatus TaxID=161469 RepID=UPI002AD42FA6|nr:urotensin 1 [Phyllopteryx taeniolatus]
MQCRSLLVLSSLLLSALLPPPPASAAAAGRLRTPQPAPTHLRAATGGDVTAARLLSFGVPRLILRGTPEEEEENDDDDDVNDEEPKFKMRREFAPLSIDLTFHLLRNMIHNARTEEHRMRAELNRKVLDEVGK